jgi:hypothetical protein
MCGFAVSATVHEHWHHRQYDSFMTAILFGLIPSAGFDLSGLTGTATAGP